MVERDREARGRITVKCHEIELDHIREQRFAILRKQEQSVRVLCYETVESEGIGVRFEIEVAVR